MQTILISGINAVGKTSTLANIFKELDFPYFIASQLLGAESANDLQQNQEVLIQKVHELTYKNSIIFLEGHTALRTNEGKIWAIPVEVFRKLKISSIILLVDHPNLIQQRYLQRSEKAYSYEETSYFQKAEYTNAVKISHALNIPLHVYHFQEKNDLTRDISRIINRNTC